MSSAARCRCCSGTWRVRWWNRTRRRARSPRARASPTGSCAWRWALGAPRGGALGRALRGPRALLIGETPLVGHRLVELARPMPDAAEPVLSDARTRFVIPVPSRELRRHLEAERGRRAARPLHPREREDAPPEVLRDLWRQLARVADALGAARAPIPPAAAPYDPALYAAVYRHVLRRRHAGGVADGRDPARGVAVPLRPRRPRRGSSPRGRGRGAAHRPRRRGSGRIPSPWSVPWSEWYATA